MNVSGQKSFDRRQRHVHAVGYDIAKARSSADGSVDIDGIIVASQASEIRLGFRVDAQFTDFSWGVHGDCLNSVRFRLMPGRIPIKHSLWVWNAPARASRRRGAGGHLSRRRGPAIGDAEPFQTLIEAIAEVR